MAGYTLCIRHRQYIKTRSVAEMKRKTPSEYSARCDLALAYRLLDKYGLNEGIDNHLTMRISVPRPAGSSEELNENGEVYRYLVNAYGMKWSQVSATNLLLLDEGGLICEGNEGLEPDPTAFCIHSAIHKAKGEEGKVVFHTHQTAVATLCCLETDEGRLQPLLMCHQNSLRYYGQISYLEEFNGLVLDANEGEKIVSSLGDKRFLFHSNHGPISIASTVARAVEDIYFLERAAEVQLKAMAATGGKVRIIHDEVAADYAAKQKQFGNEWSNLFFEGERRIFESEAFIKNSEGGDYRK